jgi:uncharacterized protein (DUF433 family)
MHMVAPNWRERIAIDPTVHHGAPVIRGTRVGVSVIVGSIADGDTIERVLGAYPQLSREDVSAALQYAAEAVSQVDFVPCARCYA